MAVRYEPDERGYEIWRSRHGDMCFERHVTFEELETCFKKAGFLVACSPVSVASWCVHEAVVETGDSTGSDNDEDNGEYAVDEDV